MLYLISYSWYEDYSPTLVEGPQVSDWKAFCDDILPLAARLALWIEPESYVGWRSIKEAMVAILKDRGYAVVEPDEFRYWGSNIINDPDEDGPKLGKDLFAAIVEHNNRVRNTTYEPVKEQP